MICIIIMWITLEMNTDCVIWIQLFDDEFTMDKSYDDAKLCNWTKLLKFI